MIFIIYSLIFISKKEQVILPSTCFSFGFNDETIDTCTIE